MGYRTSPRRWRPGPFGRRSCTRWRRTPDQAGSGGLNLAVQQRGTQASGAHRCAQFRQVARHLPRSQARATQSADPKVATVPDSRPPQASRAARSGKSSSQRLQFVFPAAAAARHAPKALPCPRGGRVYTPPGPGSADCRAGARSPGPARRRPGRAAAGTPRPARWSDPRPGPASGRHPGREQLAVRRDGHPPQRDMGAVICPRQVVQAGPGPAGGLAGRGTDRGTGHRESQCSQCRQCYNPCHLCS